MTLSQLLFSFALKEEENLGPTEGSLWGFSILCSGHQRKGEDTLRTGKEGFRGPVLVFVSESRMQTFTIASWVLFSGYIVIFSI